MKKRLKVIMIGLLLSSIMTGSALAYGTATTSNGFTVNDWYSNSPQNGGSHLYHSSGNDMWKIVNGVETYQSHYSNTTIQRGKTILLLPNQEDNGAAPKGLLRIYPILMEIGAAMAGGEHDDNGLIT